MIFFLFSFSLSFEETNLCINPEKMQGEIIPPGLIQSFVSDKNVGILLFI